MKPLLTLILLYIFTIGHFNFRGKGTHENFTGFEFTIDGQAVNKLGETSPSVGNLRVQYIRNGVVRGEANTDSDGNFSINGVITGVKELDGLKNKITITGSTIFSNTTSIEICTNNPGEVIASDIWGRTLANKKLKNPGIYQLKYGGCGASGIQLISVKTKSWHKSIRVISIGNAGATGFGLKSFKPLTIGNYLKSAEQDTLKISGENTSTAYFGFWHERSNINVGQKIVNQGPELSAVPVINTKIGEEVTINLADYIYNDDQCIYSSRDTNFIIDGPVLKFVPPAIGQFTTIVDVIDGEDSNLSKEMDVQIIVTENVDVIKPVFNSINLNGKEDESISYNLNNGATDNKTASENITWNISNGNFTSTSIDGRVVTFTPATNQSGTDNVSATITDEAGNVNTQELIINYESIPDAPVANDDIDATEFNESKTTQVLNNDTDVENDIVPTLTEIVTQPSNGTVSVNIDGSINYTPNNNFEGNDFYDYEITDATGLKDTARVTITTNVNPNTAPVLSVIPDDNTNEDVTKIGPLLDNYVTDDSTIDANIQWIVNSSDESKLKVVVNEDRKVEFTPQLNQFGTINVTYIAKDEGGLESSITQQFTINPINDAPTLNSIANVSFNEDNNYVGPTITGSDVEDALSEMVLSAISNNPDIQVNIDENKTPTYTATTNYNGSGTVTFTLTDTNGLEDTANVNVTINPINDAPIETSLIGSQSINENTYFEFNWQSKTSDVDNSDNELTPSILTLQNATYTLNDSILRITPNNNYVGTINDIIVKITDPDGAYKNLTPFNLIVNNVNEKPIANNDNTITNEDNSKTIDVLANDTDDNSLNPSSVNVITPPSHGNTNINTTTGAITYTPATNNNTNVNFEYEVADNEGLKDTATVNVTINPVDDAPVFNGSIADKTSEEDINDVFNVDNFTEVDGETLNYTVKNLPVDWSQNWNSNQVSISAPNNYNGTINDLVVEASDPQNNKTISNNFSITKTPVNDAVYSTGSIDDKVVDKGSSVVIDLKPLFEDVETADADLIYTLVGLDLGTYSVANGVATILATTAGVDYDIKAIASDGETSANSNYFTMTINDIIAKSNVTFKFRAASTDLDLTTGTSTLRYKKSGDANYTILTSTTGTFNVEMDQNVVYEIDGSHSEDIESRLGVPSMYLALKRTGDLEAFEQRAFKDNSSPIVVNSDNDVIFVYKIMNDFPIMKIYFYASTDGNGLNTGIRKFSTNDKDAPIWWDQNYDNYTTEERTWISEICNDLKSLPHVYLTLPFQEGTTTPSSANIRVAVDENFPPPGTNSTTYNEVTHEIIQGRARYPPPIQEGVFKIEILQAIGDLNDAGGDPTILGREDPDNLNSSLILNTTGRKIFSVMYLFKPKTKF